MPSDFPASRTTGRASERQTSDADAVLRIAPGADGVSIWSSALFENASASRLRDFVSRAFRVPEVAEVQINRSASYGRVVYDKTADPADIWRRLSLALKARPAATKAGKGPTGQAASKAHRDGTRGLFLDGPSHLPIRITRAGQSLSTWRMRHSRRDRVRLTHPILLNRKDVAYRLEQELACLLGVRGSRISTVTGSVAIRFDPLLISVDRIVRQFETFWPRLLDGLEGPSASTRLWAAGGLLTLSVAAQFFLPVLRPLALAGVTIYGFPNVTAAAAQAKRAQIGLPALYSFGLAMLLLSGGDPLNSTIMAVLMQSWPRLAWRTMSKSQQRLFVDHRQRATWARLRHEDGSETEVDLDILQAGDLITVRQGEFVPVDGIVTHGLAAVDQEALSGIAGAVDKAPGDPVYATSRVRVGQLQVRVETVGRATVASAIASVLPHARIADLPSATEAERIANRNAKPALALAIASLLVRRLVRPAQAIIRPDYITAHRLGAQLAALHDLGRALQQGILFRDPAALDRLAATDIYVIDESAALFQERFELAAVFRTSGVTESDVLGYAAAAFPPLQNERARALRAQCVDRDVVIPEIHKRQRRFGAVSYRDRHGHGLDIGTPAYVAESGATIPPDLAKAIAQSPQAAVFQTDDRATADPFLRPLFVIRDGAAIGALAFHRSGGAEAAETIANLKAINKNARFVHVSSQSQAAAAKAALQAGIGTVFGGLDPLGKAAVLRKLGPRAIWIGDGASQEALPSIRAATVSISTAGFTTVASDSADIVFLQSSLQTLVALRRIAREHRASLENDYRAIYATNLFGVAGGIFANFSGLHAGLISNAGTAFVYARYWLRLRDLVGQLDAHRAALTSPAFEEMGRLEEKIYTRATDVEKYVDQADVRVGGTPTAPAAAI